MTDTDLTTRARAVLAELTPKMASDYVQCHEHCPDRLRTGRALARRGLVRDVGGGWWAPVDRDLAAEVDRLRLQAALAELSGCPRIEGGGETRDVTPTLAEKARAVLADKTFTKTQRKRVRSMAGGQEWRPRGASEFRMCGTLHARNLIFRVCPHSYAYALTLGDDGLGREVARLLAEGVDFHSHLDACEQCREHPFALCSVGARLLAEGAQ